MTTRPLNLSRYGTRQVNITQQFNNLSSSGTFKLPDELQTVTTAPGPAPGPTITVSGPLGAVQLSDGAGDLTNEPTIYVEQGAVDVPSNRLVFDSSSNVIDSKPLTGLLLRPAAGPAVASYAAEEGTIVYGDPAGTGTDFYGWKGPAGPWFSLTNTGGGAVAAGGNKEIQFNSGGVFAASANLTFDTTVAPNLFSVSGTSNTNGTLQGSFADATGTYTIKGEANYVGINPAILLKYDPVGFIGGTAIQMETTQNAGIKLLSDSGEIQLESPNGNIDLIATNRRIKLERAGTSTIAIETNGDLLLETTAITNEIRLKTTGDSSEIDISTAGINTPVQIRTFGTNSNVEINSALGVIRGQSADFEILNVAANGSIMSFRDVAGKGIFINGGASVGTISPGITLGRDTTPGNIEIQNGLAGGNNLVAKLYSDVFTNEGKLDINNNTGSNGVQLTANADGGEILVNSLTTGNEAILLDSDFSTSSNFGRTGNNNLIKTVEFQGIPQAKLGFIANGIGFAGARGSGIGGVMYSGLAILPNSEYLGTAAVAPVSTYTNNPQPDSNLLLGQYGWGTTLGIQGLNVNTSWKNQIAGGAGAVGYGGSGNVYCDNVRQNVYYHMPTAAVGPGTSLNPNTRSWGGPAAFEMQSPPNYLWPITGTNHNWGYQGNLAATATGRGWYNNGNIRHLMIDVGGSVNAGTGSGSSGAGLSNFACEVRLPQINEAMVGMKVTVTRLRTAPHDPNGGDPGVYTTSGANTSGIEYHKIAVIIKTSGNIGADTDLICAPDSVVVFPNSTNLSPYVALDPYRVLVPFPNGVSNPTSNLVGNSQFNKWTVDFNMALTTGTPINDAEFPRTATTAAVPGVSILQINFAGNDVFYGRLVEINFTNTAKTQGNLVFTAPALSVAAAGQYNYQDTLDLYIGGVWNSGLGTISGAQVIQANSLSNMTRLNLATGSNPVSPGNAGFTTPYTSITSATFVASAIGSGMTAFGPSVPTKYVWNYINEYPAY